MKATFALAETPERARSPTGADNRTMLVTTGAEAVEKTPSRSRAPTQGRPAIIGSFLVPFMGAPCSAWRLTGKVMP